MRTIFPLGDMALRAPDVRRARFYHDDGRAIPGFNGMKRLQVRTRSCKRKDKLNHGALFKPRFNVTFCYKIRMNSYKVFTPINEIDIN